MEMKETVVSHTKGIRNGYENILHKNSVVKIPISIPRKSDFCLRMLRSKNTKDKSKAANPINPYRIANNKNSLKGLVKLSANSICWEAGWCKK